MWPLGPCVPCDRATQRHSLQPTAYSLQPTGRGPAACGARMQPIIQHHGGGRPAPLSLPVAATPSPGSGTRPLGARGRPLAGVARCLSIAGCGGRAGAVPGVAAAVTPVCTTVCRSSFREPPGGARCSHRQARRLAANISASCSIKLCRASCCPKLRVGAPTSQFPDAEQSVHESAQGSPQPARPPPWLAQVESVTAPLHASRLPSHHSR